MKKTILLFIAAASFTGCVKEGDCGRTRTADVYAVGYKTINFDGEEGTTVAAFWKNGVDQNLTVAPSQAFSVFVSGNDVYIAGIVYGDPTIATLWKNGVTQPLSEEVSAAYSVFVSGNDVYVAGEEENEAILWKNGVAQRLGGGRAYSVYVSGNDVYVAGFHGDATLWKNGVAQNLGGVDSYAYSVAVSGSDVYVAGADFSQSIAILWKNSVPETMFEQVSSYSPWNVSISGSDIYMAGSGQAPNEEYVATLLKNGTPQYLSLEHSSALSLMVLDGDVYVAGYKTVVGGIYPVVWKNGVEQILSREPGYAIVLSVFAKK